MGGGAPRELGAKIEAREVDPRIAEKINEALKVMDQKDPTFEQGRQDEKLMQTSKAWSNVVVDIVADLRIVGHTIIEHFQTGMDMGSEGGGLGATPFLEEAGMRWPRLQFQLEDTTVVARAGETEFGRIDMYKINYDFLFMCAAKWMVHSIKNYQG